jgi:hypothetical protein
MINNLGSSYLAKLMKESLSRRMNERWTDVSRLLQYLHKGNQGSAELNLESLLNFGRMNKTTIIAMIASLVNRPRIFPRANQTQRLKPLRKSNRHFLFKKNLNFEIKGKLGPNLEKSVSVEAERVSSECGNFGTKIRSSLNDESLEMQSFKLL